MKEQIQAMLSPGNPWRGQLHWYQTIDSTNTAAKQMAQNGAPHGTVLIADRQTSGRGRMGRSFRSPAGMGIYLSVILRPRCGAEDLMHLTCAVAVAMCDAVEAASGFRPGIKWINDLLAKQKKLGGILTELSIDPATGLVHYAVIGIGINCCQATGDFPEEIRDIAISVQAVTKRPVDRCRLAAAMMDALWKMDRKLLSQKEDIMRQYKADCVTLGQDIFLLCGDRKTACRALDLTDDGALLVQYPDGTVEEVSSGEVSVRVR